MTGEYVENEEFATLGVTSTAELSGAAVEDNELHTVLGEHLRELLHAERQLLKALPKMLQVVSSEKLATVLETHTLETESMCHGSRKRSSYSASPVGQSHAAACRD